jgi:hypothetical protein
VLGIKVQRQAVLVWSMTFVAISICKESLVKFVSERDGRSLVVNHREEEGKATVSITPIHPEYPL